MDVSMTKKWHIWTCRGYCCEKSLNLFDKFQTPQTPVMRILRSIKWLLIPKTPPYTISSNDESWNLTFFFRNFQWWREFAFQSHFYVSRNPIREYSNGNRLKGRNEHWPSCTILFLLSKKISKSLKNGKEVMIRKIFLTEYWLTEKMANQLTTSEMDSIFRILHSQRVYFWEKRQISVNAGS